MEDKKKGGQAVAQKAPVSAQPKTAPEAKTALVVKCLSAGMNLGGMLPLPVGKEVPVPEALLQNARFSKKLNHALETGQIKRV